MHPGYGFLAENASFAAACREAGITFIGPEPEVIRDMGSKRRAKEIMGQAGVPVVPGYQGEDQSERRFRKEANALGYPVMVKASAGGGGKGMRLVASQVELPGALAAARREAMSAFGDGSLMLEKVSSTVQGTSNSRFLATLTVTSCIWASASVRSSVAIRRLSKRHLHRRWTRSFALVWGRQPWPRDGSLATLMPELSSSSLPLTGSFYFLEVNTRLQVEHAITELVTELDLVRWQIQVAEGARLPLGQDDVTFLDTPSRRGSMLKTQRATFCQPQVQYCSGNRLGRWCTRGRWSGDRRCGVPRTTILCWPRSVPGVPVERKRYAGWTMHLRTRCCWVCVTTWTFCAASFCIPHIGPEISAPLSSKSRAMRCSLPCRLRVGEKLRRDCRGHLALPGGARDRSLAQQSAGTPPRALPALTGVEAATYRSESLPGDSVTG